MTQIYIEGLQPRIERHWKNLGKKPKTRRIMLTKEEEKMPKPKSRKKKTKTASEDVEMKPESSEDERVRYLKEQVEFLSKQTL